MLGVRTGRARYLPARPVTAAGTMGTPVPSMASLSGRWPRSSGGGQHCDLPARDRGSLGGEPLGYRGAVGFSAAFDPPGRQADSRQVGEQLSGRGERFGGPSAGGHRAQPGDREAPATPRSSSRGAIPCSHTVQ